MPKALDLFVAVEVRKKHRTKAKKMAEGGEVEDRFINPPAPVPKDKIDAIRARMRKIKYGR